jgi:hypothetical protein
LLYLVCWLPPPEASGMFCNFSSCA